VPIIYHSYDNDRARERKAPVAAGRSGSGLGGVTLHLLIAMLGMTKLDIAALKRAHEGAGA
jgi:hypothetical protein